MTFSVTILGSNSALPTSERHPTAQILNVSERFFLIDCGEGTQMQLRKNKIKFSRINHIFISHLHGDHVFGLMGLISTFGLLGRRSKLTIHAHADLEKLLKSHINYFCADLPYSIEFNYLNTSSRSVIFEDKKIIVETIPLKHRIPTVGFIFTEKQEQYSIRKECIEKYNLSIAEIVNIKNGGDLHLENGKIISNEELVKAKPKPRSYAYCSDTKYFKKLADQINGISLLYHESTFLDADKGLAKSTMHATATQAANIAKDANVDTLILGHFSSRYKNLDLFLNEAQQIFPNTQLGIEGRVFNVEQ